jgi:hypothetical protein
MLIEDKIRLYQLGGGVELGSSPNSGSPDTVETARLDCRAYCTPHSLVSIRSYISSFFSSYFSAISNEASCRATMRKSKSSEVRKVCILVMVAFDFFHEEGFRGEPFLFFRGSTSSPCFCSNYFSSNSWPSPPCSGDMEVVFMDALSNSGTSSVLFVLLGLGVSYAVYRLSMSDISAGSAGIRRSADQSLVISSKSSSISL